MKANQVTPRVLADDLMFTCEGPGHRAHSYNAMVLSRILFTDIGARIADNKCFMFATDSFTRDFFINFVWDLEGLKIPC